MPDTNWAYTLRLSDIWAGCLPSCDVLCPNAYQFDKPAPCTFCIAEPRQELPLDRRPRALHVFEDCGLSNFICLVINVENDFTLALAVLN